MVNGPAVGQMWHDRAPGNHSHQTCTFSPQAALRARTLLPAAPFPDLAFFALPPLPAFLFAMLALPPGLRCWPAFSASQSNAASSSSSQRFCTRHMRITALVATRHGC